jgi:hypothetical protein
LFLLDFFESQKRLETSFDEEFNLFHAPSIKE